MFGALAETHSLSLLFEEAGNEVLGERRVLGPRLLLEGHFASENVGDCVAVVLGLEGRAAGNEFVNSDSEGPNVHPFIVTASDVDFGGEVEVSADDSQHVPPHSPREGPLRNPEVNYFDLSFLSIVENVLGFDVTVAKVVAVEIVEAADELADH